MVLPAVERLQSAREHLFFGGGTRMVIRRVVYVLATTMILLTFFFGAAFLFSCAIESIIEGHIYGPALLATGGATSFLIGMRTLTTFRRIINV